jgi:hypothetical protein
VIDERGRREAQLYAVSTTGRDELDEFADANVVRR